MDEYIPSTSKWVADQVELYERSGGTRGTTLGQNGPWKDLPVIIVTNRGRKTKAVRKTPLMKVMDGDKYILVASQGGAPSNPFWYYNLHSEPQVEIQDGINTQRMKVIEIMDPVEKKRLWEIAVKTYPPYEEYQLRTERCIPVFLASRLDN